MTDKEAIKSFKNLYEDIDKENHLFIGTINPEFIMMAIKALEIPRNLTNEEIYQGFIELEAENERLHDRQEKILLYIDRLLNQGTGKKKSLEFLKKYILEGEKNDE